MTISRQEWQNDFRERIIQAFPKIRAAGINSGYAILATSAILPVIMSGTEWFTALVTMVGGLGANLIANQIQGAVDEVDIARKIDNLSASDQIHQYINVLLKKLDAQSIAQQGLPERDWFRLEEMLDRKLTQYSIGRLENQSVEVAIIQAKISGSQARQIARAQIKKNMRVQSQQKRSNTKLHHWSLAQYKASYLVRFQIEETEREKDQNGYVKNIRTIVRERVKEDIPIELAIFPRKSVRGNSSELVYRVYNAINKLESPFVLYWDNSFLQFGYDRIHRPFWEWVRYVLKFRKGFTSASKKLALPNRYGTDSDFLSSFIEVSEDLVVGDARNMVKTLLAREYNAPSGRVFLEASPTREEVSYFQYPFWEFNMGKHTSSIIIVDGINGRVLYQQSPANLFSSVLISFEMVFVGLFILAVIGFFIYIFSFLWS